MKARVQNVSLGNARRIVAVSDVHGNGRLLEQLLEEIAFCKEDRSIHTHDTDFYCGSQKLDTSAYQNTDAFASADHTHQYLPLADSTIGGDTTRYCFLECF